MHRIPLRMFWLVLFIPVCLLTSPAGATGEGWTTDVAAAIKQAQAENKDVLMDFSGSDWCHWCIQLDREVFSEDAFQTAVKDSFVLVELDFPNDESRLSAATIRQNHEWREKLQIDGFPTVMLLDNQGRPYARTGYRPGGPAAYVAHLTELQTVRSERDQAFAAAATASGPEKATLLDKALQTMNPELIYTSYLDTVKTIVQLDPDNSAGLQEKYKTGLDRLQISKELQSMMRNFRPDRADEFIDKIKAIGRKYRPTGRLKMELSGMLAQLYLMNHQEEQAIVLAEAYAKVESLHPDERVQWKLLLSTAYARQGKPMDAITVLDETITEHADNARIVLRCKVQKVQTLVESNRIDEAEAYLQQELAQAKKEDRQILQQVSERVAAIKQEMAQDAALTDVAIHANRIAADPRRIMASA